MTQDPLPDAASAMAKTIAATRAAITQIEAAEAARAAGLAALLRADGQPKYGPAEAAERRQAVEDAYNAALAGGEAVIGAARTVLARYTPAVDAGDPIWSMPTEQIARIEAIQRLATEDAREMAVTQLAARITSAARSGDRAVIFAYHRAAGAFSARQVADQERREISTALAELRAAAEAARPKPPERAAEATRAVEDLTIKIGRARLAQQRRPPVAVF